MLVTECECPKPGWCQRHKCHKSKLFWYMCRAMPARFQAWEKGDGPGQQTKRPAPSLAPCRHRGHEAIDRVECQTCKNSKVQVFVFPCAQFGECTIRPSGTHDRRAREMAACRDCPEYEPLDEESQTEPEFQVEPSEQEPKAKDR